MVSDFPDGWQGDMVGGGLAPTIMAGTHGYGFGCVLTYEERERDKESV